MNTVKICMWTRPDTSLVYWDEAETRHICPVGPFRSDEDARRDIRRAFSDDILYVFDLPAHYAGVGDDVIYCDGGNPPAPCGGEVEISRYIGDACVTVWTITRTENTKDWHFSGVYLTEADAIKGVDEDIDELNGLYNRSAYTIDEVPLYRNNEPVMESITLEPHNAVDH